MHSNAELNKRRIDNLLDEATALLSKGRNKEALVVCDEVLSIDPTDQYAHVFKTTIYSRLRLYEKGLKSIGLALKYGDPDLRLDHIIVKIEILYNCGRFEESLALIDEAIKDGVEPSELAFLKGLSLHGKYTMIMDYTIAKQILHCYKEALKTGHDRHDIFYNMGRLFSNIKRYDTSVKYFDRSLSINPTNSQVMVEKAVALYHGDRTEEAAECCMDLVRLEPNDAGVQYKLCYVLFSLGLVHEALDAVNIAYRLDPSLPGIEKTRKVIRTEFESPT